MTCPTPLPLPHHRNAGDFDASICWMPNATLSQALRILLDLLTSRPEQESIILTIIVNKLGDPDRKVTYLTCILDDFIHGLLLPAHLWMKA